jgi:hypothetical protein
MRIVCFYAMALCAIGIIIITRSAIHDPAFLTFELVEALEVAAFLPHLTN